MRKYSLEKPQNVLEEISGKLLEMSGYGISVMEGSEFDPRKYMSKSYLCFEEIDIEKLTQILSRVRIFVYVGKKGLATEIISKYIDDNDIPLRLNNPGIGLSIQVNYDQKKIVETYCSPDFSIAEIVAKYLADCGPKICLLIRYISQVELSRTSLPFDHTNIRELNDIHYEFISYHEKCTAENVPYSKDVLLEILKKHKP